MHLASKHYCIKCNFSFPHLQTSQLKDGSKVLIYLSDDESGSCSSLTECQSKCDSYPRSCSAPLEDTKLADGGVWSRDRRNNPFARHVKVFLPSCSSDEHSGTRSPPSAGSPFFHGRHILSSVLRDLVAKLRVDRASEVVLVGSGSGARGAARNCDFVSESLSTVGSAGQRVRCVLDGPDLAPYWVRPDRCSAPKGDEAEKVLWGRQDDESCLSANRDSMNSTELATACGTLARCLNNSTFNDYVIPLINLFSSHH